jgi:hypothetical protein
MAHRRVGGVAILVLFACARGDAATAAAPSGDPVGRESAESPNATAELGAGEDASATGRDDHRVTPGRSRDDAEPDNAEPEGGPADASLASTADPTRDELEGLTTDQLRARWGEPDGKRTDRWIYVFPRHDDCVEERIVMTLRLRGGKVIKAEQRSEMTGDHCAPPDD